MIAVADAHHLLEQFRVRFPRRLLIGDQAIEIAQIADAAHQIAIANASERGITHWRLRREFIRHKRRLPNLHGMQAGWFWLRAKQRHTSIWEKTVTIANLWLINAARDQVVTQDDVHAFGVFIINIGDVFAIRRAVGAHELHAGKILRENFVLAIRQVIAAWENEAVAFGQLLTALADSVDAHRFMSELVVDVIAKLVLTIRADFEQDDGVQVSVTNLGIIHALMRVFHRIAENTRAAGGIVLNLNGDVAVNAFDKYRIDNVDVRM